MGLFKKPLRHSGEELNGLVMYRGMEVNLRPPCEMGITKMARNAKMLRRSERVSEIAEGVRLGDMQADMYEMD